MADLTKIFARALLEKHGMSEATRIVREFNDAFLKELVKKAKEDAGKFELDPDEEFWDALSDYACAIGGSPAKSDETPEAQAAITRLVAMCFRGQEGNP